MTFPGAGAQVYRNEAGEVLGWDYPSEPEYDDGDMEPPASWRPDLDEAFDSGRYDFEHNEGYNPEQFDDQEATESYIEGWRNAGGEVPA